MSNGDQTTPSSADTTQMWQDRSIPMLWGNLLAVLLAVPIAAIILVPYVALWGWEAFWNGILVFGWLPVLIPTLILGIVAHELLHAIGWALFSPHGWQSVSFGFDYKTFTPYTHCRKPLDIQVYRLGGVLPGVVLGIFPSLLSLITGSGWLLWFGFLFTIAAGGDLIILWTIRDVAPGSKVQDHSNRIGCYVLNQPDV